MAFLRTLVFLWSVLFLSLVVGWAWLVGYAMLWRLLGWLGLARGEWFCFAAYAAASLWLAFFLTRRRRLS